MMTACVFDLDGVLVDSEPFWTQAYVDFCQEQFGVTLTEAEAREYEGRRVPDTLARLLVTFGDRSEPAAREEAVALAEDVVAEVARRFEETGEPIDDSVATLRELGAQGTRIGIASSSHPDFIAAALHKCGVTDLIAVQQSAYFLPRGKPDRSVYDITCERLDVEPGDTVAVEDSVDGVTSALHAGLRCVWLWRKPERPPEELAARCEAVTDALRADLLREVSARPAATPGPTRTGPHG